MTTVRESQPLPPPLFFACPAEPACATSPGENSYVLMPAASQGPKSIFELLFPTPSLLCRPVQCATPVASYSSITRESVLAHISELSDDRYEGRDSPSKGLDMASAYIAGELAEHGVAGAGDGGGFLQSFSIYGFAPLDKFRSSAKGGGDVGSPQSYGPKLFEHVVHEAEYLARTKRSSVAKTRFYEWGRVSNVVGIIEGSDPKLKDEFVIVSAHYDHIGTRSRGKDRIYNGADDNASGTAVLLSMLPELKKLKEEGKGPKRSVIFVFTAGEEKGLVGADYYRRNPLRPLSQTVAAINVDMIARLSAEQISVCDIDAKGKPNHLRPMVDSAARGAGFSKIDRNIDEYFDRQDGGVWAEAGIPIAVIFEGLTPDGRLNPDYHGVDDEIEGILKDNGGEKPARVARMTLDLLLQTANQ